MYSTFPVLTTLSRLQNKYISYHKDYKYTISNQICMTEYMMYLDTSYLMYRGRIYDVLRRVIKRLSTCIVVCITSYIHYTTDYNIDTLYNKVLIIYSIPIQ